MLSFEGIAKNFRFMIVQVTGQLESTLKLLDDPDPALIKAIRSSDDYVDTQKSMIENDCFTFLGRNRLADDRLVDAVRAVNVVTNNLERIADLSVNTARQLQYLGDLAVLRRFDYRAYFDLLLEGMGLIEHALFDRDSSRALRICQVEDRLDRLYRADLERIIVALRGSRETDQLMTVVFILHYLERMGDALLNIGEAILFAVLGERLKIRQYRVLEEALAATPAVEPPIGEVELASIWGTRSGVRVGTVEDQNNAERGEKVLFKEGNPAKLQQERENLQRWSEVAPGLAPAVVEYEEKGRDAALLLEYLNGVTFQEIVLNGEPPVVETARREIERTLRRVWSATRKPGSINGGYLRQLRKRIGEVYRLHPYLEGCDLRIGSLRVHPFAELLERAGPIDRALSAPFSVFIHGDFNLDNIIYNPEGNALHFVDVHRSCEMDYVQDVSVFLVSSFRLPVFVPRIRKSLEAVSLAFLGFVRDFAREQDDGTFEARLALGLIRSFTTSTRFELNRDFAQTMHQRAILLLTKLVAHDGRPWDSFRVPDGVLVY